MCMYNARAVTVHARALCVCANCSPPGYANNCIRVRGMMGLRLDAAAGIIESCSAYLASSGLEYVKTTISYE